MTGFVTFALGDQTFAAPLQDVREIVRLGPLRALPGMLPPMAGVLDLRGTPLPVLDVRPVTGGPGGDVLVVDDGTGGAVGVAVDAVHAVVGADDLGTDADNGGGPRAALPSYVVGVRRGADGAVLLVDLHRLMGRTPAQT